jgi:hypothetical protein
MKNLLLIFSVVSLLFFAGTANSFPADSLSIVEPIIETGIQNILGGDHSPGLILAVVVGLFELLLRILPTTRNYSVLRLFVNLLSFSEKLIPNLQKEVAEVVHRPSDHVTITDTTKRKLRVFGHRK